MPDYTPRMKITIRTVNMLIASAVAALAVCTALPVSAQPAGADDSTATTAEAPGKAAQDNAAESKAAQANAAENNAGKIREKCDSNYYKSGYEAGYQAGYDAGYSAGTASVGTTKPRHRIMHSVGAEFRPEYIFPTNPFVAGKNRTGKPIDLSYSAHLRYSFGFNPSTRPGKIYGGAYQGIGAAYYNFGDKQEIGNPVAVYLFQGARIARINDRLSLDYEWNFGLSFGWKPYDPDYNKFNGMIGSSVNAYINLGLNVKWMVTRRLDLTTGVLVSHFSNGNTKFPNAGLNSTGLRVGMTYNFGRESDIVPPRMPRIYAEAFPHHVSYDLLLFGSWRRKGVAVGDKEYAAPDAYLVAGFNFAPMYNFGYKFRAGISFDGVYDASANVFQADQIVSYGGGVPEFKVTSPSFDKQIALGLSARGEFVMPYFSINIGMGVNVLHKGGDLKSFYQTLALKVALTRNSFVHVGYCLKDFHNPNYLMLGVGYRFNNKYPRLH